jgi:hypothetical protein
MLSVVKIKQFYLYEVLKIGCVTLKQATLMANYKKCKNFNY